MIKWVRLCAGEYESKDKRFKIKKTWDRLYGNHWELYDSTLKEYYYKSIYIQNTLLDCKLKAEDLIEKKI